MKIQSILILATLLPTPLLAFEDKVDGVQYVFKYERKHTKGPSQRLDNLKNNTELTTLAEENPCLEKQISDFNSYVANEFPSVVSAIQEAWGDEIQGHEFDSEELKLEYRVKYGFKKDYLYKASLFLYDRRIKTSLAIIDMRFKICPEDKREDYRKYFVAKVIPWHPNIMISHNNIYYHPNISDPRDQYYAATAFESGIKNSSCTILSNEVLIPAIEFIFSHSIKIQKQGSQKAGDILLSLAE